MIEKWKGKGVEKELNEFLTVWDGATKITPGDEVKPKVLFGR